MVWKSSLFKLNHNTIKNLTKVFDCVMIKIYTLINVTRRDKLTYVVVNYYTNTPTKEGLINEDFKWSCCT